jgi:hypothetical protein
MIVRTAELPAAELAGRADPKPEPPDSCSFSQGEKVRMGMNRGEW